MTFTLRYLHKFWTQKCPVSDVPIKDCYQCLACSGLHLAETIYINEIRKKKEAIKQSKHESAS